MVVVGRKIYDVCAGCGKIICINKTLFGNLHLCATPEERVKYAEKIEMIRRLNEAELAELNLVRNVG